MIEVRVVYTKKARENPEIMRAVERPMVLARALAERVSQRVAQQGDLATPAQRYRTSGRYQVSDAYAQALGLPQTRYRSSAAFHDAAGVKFGTARVSGGMWKGLAVRNVGGSAAILAFQGSSLGGARQATTTKSGRQRSRPVLVRNQVKAGTVFRQSRVNVIQPKDTENSAMVAAVARWSQNVIARTLGATLGEFRAEGDQQLLRAILQLYDGSK